MQFSQELYRSEAKTRMTFAFVTYKEEGMEAVKKMFPDQFEFVLAHKDKTFQEVRIVIEDILTANFKLKRVG